MSKVADIRIQKTTEQIKKDLENIKKYTGISSASWIRNNLPSWIENYYKEFPHHRIG